MAWFYGLNTFFLTPADISSYEAELEPLDGFYASLPDNELIEDSPRVGLPCVVRYKDDGKFYRSQITSILDDNRAKVFFVDYGNEQETSLADIKRILPKYMKLPQLVWHCKLAGVDLSLQFLDLQNHLSVTLLSEDSMVATFTVADQDGVLPVNLVHAVHGNVAEYLVKNCIAQLPELKLSLRLPKLNFKPGEVIAPKGCISFIKSASEFWIQMDPEAVESMMEKIDALALRPDLIKDQISPVAIGDFCLALFPQDERYYRAIVEHIDHGEILVNYVDYGNSCCVQMSHLKTLPAELAEHRALALKCALHVAHLATTDLNKTRMDIVIPDEMLDVRFEVKCVAMDIIPEVVLTGADGNEVMPHLLKNPSIVAVPTTPAMVVKQEKTSCPTAISKLFDSSTFQQNGYEVYVSYVKSPTEFWIQLKADENIINEVVCVLGSHFKESAKRVDLPLVDQLYAIEHPSFGSHYRASIRSVDGVTVEACFIDYGDVHSALVKNVYTLPHRFLSLPALASCCCMKRREWSPEAINRFISILSDQDSVFRAILEPIIDKTVRQVDSLFLGEKNIEDIIFTELHESSSIEDNQKIDILPEASVPHIIHPQLDSNISSVSSILETICEEVEVFLRFLPKFEAKYQVNQRIAGAASVSHVGPKNDLWLQLDGRKVDEFMNIIDEFVLHPQFSQLPRLQNPLLSIPCLVQFTDDDRWYRAIVDELTADQATVTYIDYGNQETVPLSNLFCLPAQFGDLSPLALKFALDGPENILEDLTAENIESIFYGQTCEVFYIRQTKDCVVVQLLDSNRVDLMEKVRDLKNCCLAEEQEGKTVVVQDCGFNFGLESSLPILLETPQNKIGEVESEQKDEIMLEEIACDVSTEEVKVLEGLLDMKEAGDQSVLTDIPVGNLIAFEDDDDQQTLHLEVVPPMSPGIDAISSAVESILHNQGLEDIVLTSSSPTVVCSLPVINESKFIIDEGLVVDENQGFGKEQLGSHETEKESVEFSAETESISPSSKIIYIDNGLVVDEDHGFGKEQLGYNIVGEESTPIAEFALLVVEKHLHSTTVEQELDVVLDNPMIFQEVPVVQQKREIEPYIVSVVENIPGFHEIEKESVEFSAETESILPSSS